MAFLKLPMYGGLRIEDWFRQVWVMLNRRCSGVYTPTYSSATNVTALTLNEAQYVQVDDVVTIQGSFALTAASSAPVFFLDIPKTSVFTSTTNASGMLVSTDPNATGYINANAASSLIRVKIVQTPSIGVSKDWFYSLSYKIN